MKKLLASILVLALAISGIVTCAFADGPDLSGWNDSDLKTLYSAVKAEMAKRGIPLTEKLTLREGKFIVGEDIMPGTYKITCVETAGETYGSMYSSLGDVYKGLDSENDGWGALMGSLGNMMGTVFNTTVEIIGDYGTVLKSFELKGGDSTTITLTEKTALKISDGTCELEPN